VTDINWRSWVWDRLSSAGALPTLIPSQFGGGSVPNNPKKPFMVIQISSKEPEFRDGDAPLNHRQILNVWVYDEPGSYKRIDTALGLVRDALVGRDDRICVWTGDSGDLADDTYGAITRYATFQLTGGSA